MMTTAAKMPTVVTTAMATMTAMTEVSAMTATPVMMEAIQAMIMSKSMMRTSNHFQKPFNSTASL